MTRLEELRITRQLTQEAIASCVGIAISTYSQYENGHRNVPRKTAEQIAKKLGCAVDEIFLPEKFTVSKNQPPGQDGP